MARMRMIKPEFWGDEKLAPLSPLVRLVFVGLISMADDAGRLVDNLKSIDGMLFPETDDTSREALDTLARVGRIHRYRSESGQRLIQITNWSRHQKVDNPSKYTLPAPNAVTADAASTSTESSESREPQASNPREGLDNVSRSDLRPTTNDLRPTTTPPATRTKPPRAAGGVVLHPEAFERAMAAMPRRVGGHPKKTAIRAWNASIRRGADPDAIVAGAERYRAFIVAAGKERTEYVKMAATFFGPDEHWLEDWEPPPATVPNGRGGQVELQYDDPTAPGYVGLMPNGEMSDAMQRLTAPGGRV